MGEGLLNQERKDVKRKKNYDAVDLSGRDVTVRRKVNHSHIHLLIELGTGSPRKTPDPRGSSKKSSKSTNSASGILEMG